jgi:hypothetical protein
MSRVVISLAERPFQNIIDAIVDYVSRRAERMALTVGTLFGLKTITLTQFDSESFEDFVWRTLFAKTLPASDFSIVVSKQFRVCSTPWDSMHWAGLRTLKSFPRRCFHRLMYVVSMCSSRRLRTPRE